MQIDQVLSNLLENAARLAPPGSTVRLSATACPGGQTVEVRSATKARASVLPEMDHIFQPFRTGRASTLSGVGLAICKAIVEAHGGMIEATNNAAAGARLRFTVPVHHG